MEYTVLFSACLIAPAGSSDDDSLPSDDSTPSIGELQTINDDNYEAILLEAVSCMTHLTARYLSSWIRWDWMSAVPICEGIQPYMILIPRKIVVTTVTPTFIPR